MTEFPRKGDRVRVVYEGAVVSSIETLGDVRVFTDTGHTILTGRSASSIEVLERAVEPFPDGTVVLSSDKVAVYRREGRWWSTRTGRESHFNDDLVRKSLDGLGYMKLIHEPPAC